MSDIKFNTIEEAIADYKAGKTMTIWRMKVPFW